VGDADQWWADQRVIRLATADGDGPTLVAGDLNATMDHKPMRQLLAAGYADAATEAKSRWQPTWPSSGEVTLLGVPVPSMLAIDHVLVQGGSQQALRPVQTQTFTVFGTDHRALVAALDP
jgi:endonuclease/exonuclease/phosphatase family metal-dependent hydrolase